MLQLTNMTPVDYMTSIHSLTRNKRVISGLLLAATTVWFVASFGMWYFLKREANKVDLEV